MKNEDLLKRVSDSLFIMCIENDIKLINRIELYVDQSIQIDLKDLFDYLLEEIPFFMGVNTTINTYSVKYRFDKIKIKFIEGLDHNHETIIVKNN